VEIIDIDYLLDDIDNTMKKRSEDNNIISYYYKLKLTDKRELKIIDNWENLFGVIY